MSRRLGLGSAVGLAVSQLFWRGNQTPSVVYTFPDGFTFLMLVGLLIIAIGFERPRQPGHDQAAFWRAGLTIAAAAGIVFGSAVAVLGEIRFSHPSLVLQGFGFLTAFGSSLACGVVATLAWSRRGRAQAA